MSGKSFEPIGRDRLELPCIVIPDGYEGVRPSHAFGRDALQLDCMFIRGGDGGPRPGYPWIEFGRMTLHRGPAAGKRERTQAARQTSSPVPDTGGLGRMDPIGELGGYASPNIAATMALWNWLCDPRAVSAALGRRAAGGNDIVSSVGAD